MKRNSVRIKKLRQSLGEKLIRWNIRFLPYESVIGSGSRVLLLLFFVNELTHLLNKREFFFQKSTVVSILASKTDVSYLLSLRERRNLLEELGLPFSFKAKLLLWFIACTYGNLLI